MPIIPVTSSIIEPSRLLSSRGVSNEARLPLEAGVPVVPTAAAECRAAAPSSIAAAIGSICLMTSGLKPVCAAAFEATVRLASLLPSRWPRMLFPSVMGRGLRQ